ncbi:MAG: ARMT1-like domain-containing protein, partial [Candidatus Brocadiaceae bacterium]
MKTYLECIPCFMQQALDAVTMVTDDEELRLSIMRRVLEAASRFPPDAPPPAMGAEIHRLIRSATGNTDPYREVKRRANEFALDLMPRLLQMVIASPSALGASLRLAVAGNVMDWGARPHTDVSEVTVESVLKEALSAPLVGDSPRELRRRLQSAEDVLYLADNAGEIALDRLFIGFIPCPDITLAVKSGPVINDATMEDARQVGLT